MRVPFVLSALAAASLVAGCSAPGVNQPAASPAAPDEPTWTYAMTGEPGIAGTKPRSVLTVKIDNTIAGRPQQGIRQADLVVEEPVEGGLTRLAAFYESASPDSVGPVRSMRTSDIGLVKPVAATLIASGGDADAVAIIERAGVPMVLDGAPGFVRNPDRIAPYNLYADLTEIRKTVKGSVPAQSYLQFGEFAFPAGQDTDEVHLAFSPLTSSQWEYHADSRTWSRGERGAGGFSAKTLLMLLVKLVDTGQKDAAGSPVPEVVSTGSGRGYLAVDGTAYAIRWSKESAADPFVLTTEAGLVISVPPGRTWIALLPRKGGDASFS